MVLKCPAQKYLLFTEHSSRSPFIHSTVTVLIQVSKQRWDIDQTMLCIKIYTNTTFATSTEYYENESLPIFHSTFTISVHLASVLVVLVDSEAISVFIASPLSLGTRW